MDEQSLPTLIPVSFEKGIGEERRTVRLIRFRDGSAYLEGDEERVFEGKSVGANAPWKSALDYLESNGYKKSV